MAAFSVDDLVYSLPSELIAQVPLKTRDASRLLVLDRANETITHAYVKQLPHMLRPALWVFNDSKVFPARLLGVRCSKGAAGGRVEVLLIQKHVDAGYAEHVQTWRAWGRPAKRLAPGDSVQLGGDIKGVVVQRYDDGSFDITLESKQPLDLCIEQSGQLALPPYITRAPSFEDRERYQTIFALSSSGMGRSVAAPTAGLHFSHALIAALEQQGHRIAKISLHVGAGTFAPLRSNNLDAHTMHTELYEVPLETTQAIHRAKREGMPLVAVGTTVVRTLESISDLLDDEKNYVGETDLFIRPPFNFKYTDALLTNFHLPKSTLLALVMAFGGIASVRRAYQNAIEDRYRFFSYGDAMLII